MTRAAKLDTTGLLCPLPVLRIIKCLRSLEPGDSLTVTADDPAAAIDIPHFCSEHGHKLARSSQNGSLLQFEIRKC